MSDRSSISRITRIRRCATDLLRASGATIRQLPGEVIENAQKIVIQIHCSEFMQIPGLGLGLTDNARAAAAPCLVQLIHLFLAVKVQPDQHCPSISILFAKGAVGQEDSAASSGNLTNPAILSTPILGEAEAVLVVCGSLVHIIDWYLGYCAGEFFVHSGSSLSIAEQPRSLAGPPATAWCRAKPGWGPGQA